MRYKRKIGSHTEPIFQMCYKRNERKLAERISTAAEKDQQPDPVTASASVGIVVEKTEAASAASTAIISAADRE